MPSETLEKARKAKGLHQWESLQHIADKLRGKKVADITFTTAYPGQEGQKKRLGSTQGNYQFLMGYANPGFHVASYHWQIVDPNLSDTEARDLCKTVGHPSRPEVWAKIQDKPGAEGDLEEGRPHESFVVDSDSTPSDSGHTYPKSFMVRSGAGSYKAVPSEGLVYGLHNRHVYKWDLVKDTFFAASNPEMAEAMNVAMGLAKSLSVSSGVVPGRPTPGFERLPSDIEGLSKSVCVEDDGTFRLIVS